MMIMKCIDNNEDIIGDDDHKSDDHIGDDDDDDDDDDDKDCNDYANDLDENGIAVTPSFE